MNDEELTLTLDGVTHNVSDLPADIQDLVKVYKKWEQELSDQRIEVFKLEAAIKAVNVEIMTRIKRQALEDETRVEAEAAVKEKPKKSRKKSEK